MGVLSETDLERADEGEDGGVSVDVEMVRFIREEIRTAVQQELNTTSTAPPSYDSSAPLLMEDSTAPDSTDRTHAEAQHVDEQKPPAQGSIRWLRVIAVSFPFLAIVLSMPALSISRVDELYISVLAFFLLIIPYAAMTLSVISFACLLPKRFKAGPPPAGTPDAKYIGILFISWLHLFSYIGFIVMVYWWLSGRPDSLWARFRNTTAFDEMLGMMDGMEKLAQCLSKVDEIQKPQGGEGRKARIEDVVACLVDMGVDATGKYC